MSSDPSYLLAYAAFFYTAEILGFSWWYTVYLRGGREKPWRLAIRAATVFAMLALPVYISMLSTPVAIPSLTFALTAVLASRRRLPRCPKPERIKVNGVEALVCPCDMINAWYDPGRRRILTCRLVTSLLSSEELLAVILHEKGHAKARYYTLASAAVYALWLATMAGIATLVSILGLNAAIYTAISLLLAAAMTLPAMLVSWVAEHEADAEAARGAGIHATISALAKLHVYGALERHLRLVNRVELKNPEEIIAETPRPTFTTVMYELLVRNWRLPLHALDLLRNPAYHTHPPLELRIAYLASRYTSTKSPTTRETRQPPHSIR